MFFAPGGQPWITVAVESGVLICNSCYCIIFKISSPLSMLSWPLNFRMTHQRPKQPFQMQHLGKSKQNGAYWRNKWRKKPTTKTCGSTFCMQINIMYYTILFSCTDSNYILNDPCYKSSTVLHLSFCPTLMYKMDIWLFCSSLFIFA